MQSSKEQQEEIRKPSSAINAKKQRKQQNGKVQGSLQENQRHQQNFSCKDGQNKGQKWYGLTEEEDIKRRRQEYTGELYKKDLHDPDNHDGVITHLEPDILECEVKWALGSITRNKASGSDGITVELFQILKDDAVKVLHSICQQIWKTQQWPQDWKRSVFIPIPKKGKGKGKSLSRVQLFVIPWTVAYQGPLSMGFYRQDYWSGLPFSFSNPKERQCQRMVKLPHNCTHLTRQQSNAQNSPSQPSTVHEP